MAFVTKDDLGEFSSWYIVTTKRRHGYTPTANTMRSKLQRITLMANLAWSEFRPDENPQDAGEVFVNLRDTLSDRMSAVRLLDLLALRQYTPGSMRSMYADLGSFYRWRIAKGEVQESQLCVFPSDLPDAQAPPPIVVYSEEDMEKFVNLSVVDGLRWHAFMMFLVDTGRRVGETLELRWDEYRSDARSPYFQLPTTKNRQPQYVPVSTRFKRLLNERNIERLKKNEGVGTRSMKKDPGEYLFPWAYGVAKKRFQFFCQRIGVEYRGFHNIRHTVITDRVASGMPIQAVSALAGHSSITTTDRRYNHANALHYAALAFPIEVVQS